MEGFAYLPGDEPANPGPLARYLPPLPFGVSTAFLKQHVASGAWVLDPFGAAPQLIVEMARLGYRVLVAINNPVMRFLTEAAANPPTKADLQAALAELAAARKGEERLETHLQSLYLTNCQKCQQVVQAEAFIWERGGTEPVGRIYRCPCGDNGEYPCSDADRTRAAQLAASVGLHRSRALERVTAPHDRDRVHAEEALACYLPRAVYILSTIINKLDSFTLTPERRRSLVALLLTAFDEANTLWPYPTERPRPRQLTVPPRYLEKNIWRALEQAVEVWKAEAAPVLLSIWPALPPENGGICLFEGPMRDLAPRLQDMVPRAVVTALPRPNQAFWTLSALWAGWLWGREAVGPFKSVLHRRRYDWNWHAEALHGTLNSLSGHLPLNAPLFALLAEAEPPFLTAALQAAAGAGFDLHGLAVRTRHDPLQIVWHRRAFSHEAKEEIEPGVVQKAISACLQERSEPVPYLTLHAASLVAMAEGHTLPWQEEALAQLHAPILSALGATEFVHLAGSENPETGLWAEKDWEQGSEPLPDRVEIAVVRFLLKNPGCTFRALEGSMNVEFPGLQTPSIGILRAVLASYALESRGSWNLRPEEIPASRRADLESAAQDLMLLGPRLGYRTIQLDEPQRVVLWQEDSQTTHAFYLLASAAVGRLLRQDPYPNGNRLLVLPGGRAGLLVYKLQRDPTLKKIAEPWRTLKFRTLRRLAVEMPLTRELWEKELASDPIEPPEQMKLL